MGEPILFLLRLIGAKHGYCSRTDGFDVVLELPDQHHLAPFGIHVDFVTFPLVVVVVADDEEIFTLTYTRAFHHLPFRIETVGLEGVGAQASRDLRSAWADHRVARHCGRDHGGVDDFFFLAPGEAQGEEDTGDDDGVAERGHGAPPVRKSAWRPAGADVLSCDCSFGTLP